MTEEWVSRYCIVCHARLCGEVDHKKIEDYVSGGVACISAGNYGSAVFDPGNHLRLEICICDSCLLENAEYINTYMAIEQPVQFRHKRGIHDSLNEDNDGN